MDNGDVLLEQILGDHLDKEDADYEARSNVILPAVPTPTEGDDKKEKSPETYTQWAIAGNGRFMPVGSTIQTVPAGIYQPFATPGSWGLELLTISSDSIYTLPDMATEMVLAEVTKFWNSEQKYRDHSLLYKRGILLWGPPGSGKTVTVKLLMNELIRRGGIVMLGNNIQLTTIALRAIRKIEEKRNIIVVLEDIDEIINYSGEAQVLSMLDGENNVDNILNLATTNYPERLGARIINRPSRFDRRVHVGMPSPEARSAYLSKATKDGVKGDDLTKWVADTHDMSIAHLRELVAAVYCLEQDYTEVIERLKAMAVQVKSGEEFKRKGNTGFNPIGQLRVSS